MKSSRHKLPIYTLQMLNQRIYVVNSPELVLEVQRQTKSLSFQPFVAAMLPKLFLVDEDAMTIVKRNMDGEEGEWGLIPDTHRETWPALAPGPQLDILVESMLSNLLPFLNQLADPEKTRPHRFVCVGPPCLYACGHRHSLRSGESLQAGARSRRCFLVCTVDSVPPSPSITWGKLDCTRFTPRY